MQDRVITNIVEESGGGFSKIVVSSEAVILEHYMAPTPEAEPWQTRYDETYRSVSVVSYGVHRYAQAVREDGHVDLFSIDRCCRIGSFAGETYIVPQLVSDVLFFVVRMDDGKYLIYNEYGDLLMSSYEHKLGVCFSGSGPVISKTRKCDGRISYYTLEGYLSSVPELPGI